MPKINSETKDSIVYLRLTTTIKDLIEYQATQEGITPSEWLRKLIIKELRERNAISTTYKLPSLLTEEKDR
jgi:hypothetical protein